MVYAYPSTDSVGEVGMADVKIVSTNMLECPLWGWCQLQWFFVGLAHLWHRYYCVCSNSFRANRCLVCTSTHSR